MELIGAKQMKILILGAGPAGSSSAIQLLKAGHQVTLLDRQKFPRPAPGETLHPGVEPLLEKLEVLSDIKAQNIIRHKGITQIHRNKTTFAAYNKKEHWMGFQLYRSDFDFLLLKKAKALGAIVYENIYVTSIKTNDDGSIKLIEGNSKRFEADYFIDATGKRAWLSQMLKLKTSMYSPKRIAYYGYADITTSSISLDLKTPHLIWDKEGWTWLAQVKETLISWARLNLEQHRKIPKDWLPKEIKKILKILNFCILDPI